MTNHIIDAKGKKLGRLASEIAVILQGKKKPTFEPRLAGQERILVKNVDKILVSGRKSKQKVYYRHTGPLGHLKTRKYEEVFSRRLASLKLRRSGPAWILRHAVSLMLPRNRLRNERLKRLIIE